MSDEIRVCPKCKVDQIPFFQYLCWPCWFEEHPEDPRGGNAKDLRTIRAERAVDSAFERSGGIW